MNTKTKIFAILGCLALFFCCAPVFAADYTFPLLKIFSSKTLKPQGQFLVFDKNFQGGGYTATGDINGDGKQEIIVGAGYGGGPRVRIFNHRGKEIMPSFLAFEESYKNGVSVATGDLNGDGRVEIIVGRAREDKAEIAIYKIEKSKIKKEKSFFAFAENYKIGVNLAACDINADKKAEIIAAPGEGGGPQVRIFDKNGKNLGLDFMAYESTFRGGVSVACGNVTGDSQPEIIVGPQANKKVELKVYKFFRSKERTPKTKNEKERTPKNQNEISALRAWTPKGENGAPALAGEYKDTNTFLAFSESFTGGVNLATADLDGNGKKEILSSVAQNGGPQVKAFSAKGKTLAQFLAYDENFRGGVRLAAANLDKKSGEEIITMPGMVTQKKCEHNCIALTFDDGYGALDSFPRILDILKARNVHVSFFILGKAMQAYPHLMRRIVNEGHLLANHGYSHGFFPGMLESQIRSEIEYTDQIAYNVTGKHTKPYFRYPYGQHDSRTDAILKNLGYKYYHWTGSTGDSGATRSTQNSLWGALAGLHDGSIILAHTQSPQTAAALDQIITAIQNGGYHLVTVAEMP